MPNKLRSTIKLKSNLAMFRGTVTILIVAICSQYSSYGNVLIIGAGPAGLAAGVKLLENNYTDFKILEAEDRIGGRVKSVKFGDAFIDLGAEWCHGEDGNVVHEMVKDLDILRTMNYSGDYFYSNLNQSLDPELKKAFDGVLEDYLELTSKLNSSVKLSAGDLFLEKYNKTVLEMYKNDTLKLKIAEDAITFMEQWILSYDSAFSWFDLASFSNFEEFSGNTVLNWNGLGYKTALDVLMKKYPDPSKALPIDDKIMLSKQVSKISWKNKPVLVETIDGSNYTADYVLFTPSVGVLKSSHKNIFTPELNADKIRAIDNIGIGAVGKVLLHFPNKWWKDSDTLFNFIWSKEAKAKLLVKFPQKSSDDGQSWLSNLGAVHQVPKNPNVLEGWFMGPNVPVFEKLSDQIIIDGTMYAIRHFLGRVYNVTDPDQMIHTNWYTNPHFQGTYSFDTTKGLSLNADFRKDLATPLKNVDGKPALLFAGEATNSDHFATVQGAIETGRREADRIIELEKLNNSAS